MFMRMLVYIVFGTSLLCSTGNRRNFDVLCLWTTYVEWDYTVDGHMLLYMHISVGANFYL